MKEFSVSKLVNGPNPYVILIGLVLIVYFKTLFFGYIHLDDDYFRYDNPDTKEQVSDFGQALSSPYMHSTYYRPIVNLSFTLDANIDGKSAMMHHVTNLLLHAANTCLFFVLFLKLSYSRPAALFFALLFAVHPLLSNAVGWIVGRNDLLVSMFSVLSIIQLFEYLKNRKTLNFVFHTLFMILALFSKEAAVLLPVISFIIWFLYSQSKNVFKNIGLFLAWLSMPILFVLLKIVFETGMLDPYASISNVLLTYRTIPENLSKLLLPLNIPGLPSYDTFTTISGFVIILIIGTIVYIRRNNLDMKRIALGALWYIIPTIPVLFIHMNNIHKEDYLYCRVYFPIIGIFIILLELIPEDYRNFRKNTIILAPVVVILLFIMSFLTIKNTEQYKDPVTFWQCAVDNSPEKGSFVRRLGSNIAEIEHDYERAKLKAEEAIKLDPMDGVAYMDLSFYYSELGMPAKAIACSKKSIEVDPRISLSLRDLAYLYYKIGNADSAYYYAREYERVGGSMDPAFMAQLEKKLGR